MYKESVRDPICEIFKDSFRMKVLRKLLYNIALFLKKLLYNITLSIFSLFFDINCDHLKIEMHYLLWRKFVNILKQKCMQIIKHII